MINRDIPLYKAMQNVKNAPKSNIANVLRQLRTVSGLSQKAVARALFIDRSSYAYYEVGKTHPKIDMLIQIAYLFEVSVDSLLGVQDLPEKYQDDKRL